ncbi:MAG: type III pantothenate kinase [Barnesiella sp.]|nr:type III pantothenate kinase [Bacteroidales bacterium]MBD5235636.1 type III pantothenate kinase [Barnesiella sp.]MBD5247709.1 type III pantothenate kinase [Barnesiella sp.]MBD5258714.1 type III pantothenate kinase [Barnesiella sp.]
MINLTIDRGNTTTKLVLWEGSEPVATSTLFNADNATLLRAVGELTFDRAAICTVAGDVDGLEEMLAKRGVKLLTLTASTPLPIGNRYATPLTLGVDRIAAAVGAFTLYPGRELLVADIGTCVTYDRIDADGNFLGGNIAPGIGMRLRAMFTFTKALPDVASAGDTPVCGYSTDSAMRAGAFYGVVAEVKYYHTLLGGEGLTLLTGGWSEKVARALDIDAKLCPLLVNRGLNRILQYNEINPQ